MPLKQLNRSLCWALLAAPIACAGCTQNWWNAFIDPSQTGDFRHNQMVEIQKSISFNDKPIGIPGSGDPTPEDLVAYVEEYRIGPGDALTVVLLDFLQVGAETTLTPLIVDELGYINIPILGRVQAEGRTAYELQEDLIQLAKQAEIYSEDGQPTVTVTVLNMQQRLFHISGPASLVNSGSYQIIRPDFRLREAITMGGSLDPVVKNIYVFRNQPRAKRVRERTMKPANRSGQSLQTQPAPPVSPVFMAETGSAASAAAGQNATRTQTRPASNLATPQDQAERELIEAVEPGTTSAPATPNQHATSSGPAINPATSPAKPNWQFVNDRFIEVEPNPAQTPSEPTKTPATTSASSPSEPVDWQELAEEGQQRIIRIPAEKLRAGEPSVDIVIRHQDWIRLDTGPVGVFYLNGHVSRPGTYTFQGEEITLRQAIASAGGLDALAWPSRCSITRRIDEDREETLQLDLARIQEGKDPDFYLKPNDLVDVGTHAIAPFLATIRNSFRLTYGFGFVYDRNFADLDAYFPQQNPTDRRRATLSARFPGLFP